MNRIDLLQETADIISENFVVCQGLDITKEHSFFSRTDTWESGHKVSYINIPLDIKVWKDDVRTPIHIHTLIDLGFDFTEICSYQTFTFFHEIGHLVNGFFNELEYIARVAMLPKPKVKEAYEYIRIPEELYAWLWAWDFIKSNKEYVKKLDSQLEW